MRPVVGGVLHPQLIFLARIDKLHRHLASIEFTPDSPDSRTRLAGLSPARFLQQTHLGGLLPHMGPLVWREASE